METVLVLEFGGEIGHGYGHVRGLDKYRGIGYSDMFK
jgi:hypothetical protein